MTANISVNIILCSLLLCLSNGCFLPLSLPTQRRDMTLVAAGDKVFFAGGVQLDNQVSSRVDVFDTSTYEWTYFNLALPRRNIATHSYGSRVIFFGGFADSAIIQVVEIYDLRDRSLTTVQIPEQYRFKTAVIGESKAVIFGRIEGSPAVILVLDLVTLEFTVLPEKYTQFTYNLGISNGTHAYLITTFERFMEIIDLETLTSTNVTLSFPTGQAIQVHYSEGFIFFVSPLQVEVYSTMNPEILAYTYRHGRALSAASSVIGQNVYQFSAGYTITNPFVPYQIFHTLPRNIHMNVVSSVAANNVIVFRDASVDEQRYFMLDTQHTLQQLISSVSTVPSFTVRETIFFFQETNITTFDFNTRTLTVHPYYRTRGLAFSTVSRDKLGFITRTNQFIIYLYDFNTHVMDKVELPTIYGFNDAVGLGDFITLRALDVASTYNNLHVLNVNTHSLTVLQLGATSFTAYNDTVLAVATRDGLILFDIVSNSTIVRFPLPQDAQVSALFVANNFIFVARTLGGSQINEFYVFDIQRNTMTRQTLSTPAINIQMVVLGRHVAFTGTVTTETQPVDIFDTVNLTWRTVILPRTPYSFTLVLLAINGKALVGRSLTVEMIDVEAGTFNSLPFPVLDLQRMTAVGSKLIAHMAPSSSVISITIYEVTTGHWTSIQVPTGIPNGLLRTTVDVVSNYVMISLGQAPRTKPYVMPFATLLEGFNAKELFIGQSTNFTVSTAGPSLRYQWTHEGDIIQNDSPTLALNKVTLQSDGNYRVQIVDHCNFYMTHEARLTVNNVPLFSVPLQDSVVLCDRVEELPIETIGAEVQYKWTIDSAPVTNAIESVLNVSTNDIPCHSTALVCAYAFNPSGQSQSCAQVQMLELDSVITGPRPTASSPTWFSESIVNLSVEITEEDCTSHMWFVDGVNVTQQVESQSSTLPVKLAPAMAKSQYYVVVTCGNSHIESRRFSFEQVSALPVYAVPLIVVGVFIGIAVFLIVIILQRKKLNQSQDKEVELTALLSSAKTDSLMKESVPLINKTTWQWTPSDDFSYKSLESLPINIDTSHLKFVEKGEPLEIGMAFNKELQISSKSLQKKTKKSTILTEKLISGTKVDIYAPQSPKYEVTVEPETIYIDDSSSHSVTVSVRMRMTTKTKVILIVVLEQHKIYSAIEFKLDSKMSTWIDLEEIEMSGEFLGGGGFGSVVRGVYRGQDVAVKKLLSQYLTDDMKIEFEREVTLMKSLRHPNIVQFVGASNVKESLALVIEYAPLGSLASVMEKQSLSVQLKVQCLLETAKALQFLHSNGIIHRDIKPQNVLVFSLETRSPVHVKLTDFGTSRFIADDPTTITKNVGTTVYMAPEALGRNPRIDKSADVYSFALLMWSVLFEQVPFKEFQWDSDIEQHVKSGNRLPFPHGHEIDPLLVKLIEECWQHDPKQRPSINVVVQRLTNIK